MPVLRPLVRRAVQHRIPADSSPVPPVPSSCSVGHVAKRCVRTVQMQRRKIECNGESTHAAAVGLVYGCAGHELGRTSMCQAPQVAEGLPQGYGRDVSSFASKVRVVLRTPHTATPRATQIGVNLAKIELEMVENHLSFATKLFRRGFAL